VSCLALLALLCLGVLFVMSVVAGICNRAHVPEFALCFSTLLDVVTFLRLRLTLIGLGVTQLDHLLMSARIANLAVGLLKMYHAVILARFPLMSLMNQTSLKNSAAFWAIRVY